MSSSDDPPTDWHNEQEFLRGDSTRLIELEFERQQCLDDIRSRLIDLYRPFFQNVSKVVLIDVALQYNLGDTILWRAAIHLATIFGHTVHYVCVGSQHSGLYATFPRCDMEKLIELVKDNGLVMYHPGGNWGNLYRSVQKYRLGVLERLGKAYKGENATFKVIQLPQSIAYIHGKEALVRKDDAIIDSLPSGMFTLFTRQDDSFQWASNHYKSNIDTFASPDIAFVLGQLRPIGKPVIDVVFVVRDDDEIEEKRHKLKKKVAERFEGTGLTYVFQDWGYSDQATEYAEAHPTILSEVRLNAAIKTVSRGRVLVTNLFHGHVVGMMVGITTFWIDTIQGKISHSRAVALNSSIHCTDKCMRSFGFKSTMPAIDAAIAHLGSHRPDIQP